MAGDTMVIRGQTYDGWMAEIDTLRSENTRLREDNRVIMAADKATCAENQGLRAALTEIAGWARPPTNTSMTRIEYLATQALAPAATETLAGLDAVPHGQ